MASCPLTWATPQEEIIETAVGCPSKHFSRPSPKPTGTRQQASVSITRSRHAQHGTPFDVSRFRPPCCIFLLRERNLTWEDVRLLNSSIQTTEGSRSSGTEPKKLAGEETNANGGSPQKESRNPCT